MKRVLHLVATNRSVTTGSRGRAEHAGRHSSVVAWRRRGLLPSSDQLTELGRQVLSAGA